MKIFIILIGLLYLFIPIVLGDCINCGVSDVFVGIDDHITEYPDYFKRTTHLGWNTKYIHFQLPDAGKINLYIRVKTGLHGYVNCYDSSDNLLFAQGVSTDTYHSINTNLTKGYIQFQLKTDGNFVDYHSYIYKDFLFNYTSNDNILDFKIYEGELNQPIKVWNRYKINGLSNIILVGSDSSALLYNGYNASFNQNVDMPDGVVDESGIYQFCSYNWDSTVGDKEQTLCWDVFVYDHGSTFYSGYVRSDYDNMPVENALIELYALDYIGYMTMRTDHNGYYKKYNIPFGRYNIKISHSNYASHSHFSVFNQSIIQEDIYLYSNCLENPKIIGHINDNETNNPISNVEIIIYNNLSQVVDIVYSNFFGGYHSKCLEKGNYSLYLNKIGYEPISKMINTSNFTYQYVENFYMQKTESFYEIDFKIYDIDTMQEIINFSIVFDDYSLNEYYLWIQDLIEMEKLGLNYSISNNVITIENLKKREYVYHITSAGYEETIDIILIDQNLIKIVLIKNSSKIKYYNISGYVKNENGSIINNAVIVLNEYYLYDVERLSNHIEIDMIQTNQLGYYEFFNISDQKILELVGIHNLYDEYHSDLFQLTENLTHNITLQKRVNLFSISGIVIWCKHSHLNAPLSNIPVEIYSYPMTPFIDPFIIFSKIYNDSYIAQVFSNENGEFNFNNLEKGFYILYFNGSQNKYTQLMTDRIYVNMNVDNLHYCLDSLILRNWVRIYISHVEFLDFIEPKIYLYNNYKQLIDSKICTGDSCYFILEPALYFFDAKKFGFRIHSINEETSFRRPYPFSVHGDVEELVILMSDDLIPYIPETQEEFLIFLDKWGWKFGIIVIVLFPILVSIMIVRQIYNNVRGRRLK